MIISLRYLNPGQMLTLQVKDWPQGGFAKVFGEDSVLLYLPIVHGVMEIHRLPIAD